MRDRRILRPHLILLLTLLLPSSALCGVCTPDWCPMRADPKPAELTEPTGCHQQMADHGSEEPVIVAAASLRPDCCAVSADSESGAPAVLTTASAGVFLIEAVDALVVTPDTGSSVRPRWVPPPRHQPLYHLHSSLLI